MAMKGWGVNLALLAVLAGSAGGLFWWEQREAARAEAEQSGKRLASLAPEAVKEVRFHTLDKVIVAAARQEEGWRLTAPKPLDADQGTFTRLLSALTSSYQRKVGDAPGDLAAYGLAEPVARVTVADGQGKSETLLVGNTAPAGQGRYLRLGESGPVVIAEPAKVAGIVLEYKEFRHKGLGPVGLGRDDLARVALARGGETVVLSRAPAQPWTIESPWRDQADSDRVGGWLNLLLMAQGTDFKDVPDRAPEWTLTLAKAEGEPRVIKVWKGEKELLAQRAGEDDALSLADYLAEDLDKPAADLVFLRPWPVDKALAKLTVSRGGQSRSAEKKEGKWPEPAWGALEEALVREAWKGQSPKVQGEPVFTLTAEGDGATLTYPFRKEQGSLIVGLAGRPVDLLLTSLISKNLEESVGALFGEKKPEPKSDAKP